MKFLFVFAHPDDETFSSGGTIAKLSKAGYKVNLITATKGEAGEPGNVSYHPSISANSQDFSNAA